MQEVKAFFRLRHSFPYLPLTYQALRSGRGVERQAPIPESPPPGGSSLAFPGLPTPTT